MALSQDRYISIKSTNAGTPAVTNRELGGLCFTLGKGWRGEVPWDYGTAVVIHSAAQAVKYFASESAELIEAQRYFNYASPSGTAPTTLTYIRMKVQDGTNVSAKVSVEKMASSTITATANPTTLWAKVGKKTGSYVFEFQGTSWTYGGSNVNIADYGITVTNSPVSGDKVIAVVSDMLSWKKNASGVGGWYNLSSTTAIASPTIETPVDAYIRVDKDTNNFGSFNYIDLDTWTCKNMRDVAIANAVKNYKYLFSVACLDSGTTDPATDATKMDLVKTTAFKTYLTNGDVAEEYKTEDGINGTAIINGYDVFSATMPMALFSAVNYDGVNTATNFMFKRFSGETATVVDDDIADTFDAANINYYGLVQINGQRKAFYQPGVNSDGENTAVFCNEIWLKSRISTSVMNLMLETEMIPANEDGELMLYSTISSVASKGVTNGMIEIAKELTDEQKAKIFQLTGDSDAWFTVQNSGFYLIVTIEQTSEGKYKAVYKLIYSKGDSIVKVEGTDILI